MSQYVIDVDDTAIKEQVQMILNRCLSEELRSRYSDTGHEISAAVKDLVYSRKDEILDKVVERATAEIVKKGLPKLIARLGG